MSGIWRILIGLALGLSSCGGSAEGTAWAWDLPADFPQPWVPPDNPMTVEKALLGQHLFYDERVSGNGTMSCASCHEQARAFSDGKVTPDGSTGDHIPRNSPSIANVAYFSTYTWANPLLETLEQQAVVPLTGELPVELGVFGANLDVVVGRLDTDPASRARFEAAFPDDAAPVTLGNIVRALSTFERTIITADSPYDRYVYVGEALSASALRGEQLFFGEKGECYHCHGGLNFTSSFRAASSQAPEGTFHNTGLYDVDGAGAYPAGNQGLFEITGDPADMGRFRVPSLRNVAVTAPYMHDGSVATLEDVIEVYSQGGRDVPTGPNQGDGRNSPHKDPLVRRVDFTASEKTDLVEFLRSLTDAGLLSDPRFADPEP